MIIFYYSKTCLFPVIVTDRHSVGVRPPSALTPGDIPLDEHDLCSGRETNPVVSCSPGKQRQHHHAPPRNNYFDIQPHLPISNSPKTQKTAYTYLAYLVTGSKQELKKEGLGGRREMLAAVMGVEKNALALSLWVMQEQLGGNLCLVQRWVPASTRPRNPALKNS